MSRYSYSAPGKVAQAMMIVVTVVFFLLLLVAIIPLLCAVSSLYMWTAFDFFLAPPGYWTANSGSRAWAAVALGGLGPIVLVLLWVCIMKALGIDRV